MQVTSCMWSADGELAVSGSLDCTIRVWRALAGLAVAVCDCGGLAVHRVLMADDKRTLAALAGDTSAPKLVLLHVTRTSRHHARPADRRRHSAAATPAT